MLVYGNFTLPKLVLSQYWDNRHSSFTPNIYFQTALRQHTYWWMTACVLFQTVYHLCLALLASKCQIELLECSWPLNVMIDHIDIIFWTYFINLMNVSISSYLRFLDYFFIIKVLKTNTCVTLPTPLPLVQKKLVFY